MTGSECFNEAPAILPGKAPDSARCPSPSPKASMRPRRFCRGKRPALKILHRPDGWLQ